MKPSKCKKIAYKSEIDARLMLVKLQNKKSTKKKPVRFYQCFCGKWHLTSRLDVKDISLENENLRIELEKLKKELDKFMVLDTNKLGNNSTMNRFYKVPEVYTKIIEQQHKQIKLLQNLLKQKK
jgi:hypothetical protein